MKIAQPVIAVFLGVVLGVAFTAIAGENPWNVAVILFKGSFGSLYDFGMTLAYSTPLVFTGLSVAFAFRAGLFNIGAEGQLTLGALAAAAVGIVWPHFSSPLAPLAAGLAAAVAGGLWGFIPGWLKARRGSHEVITTIMLNFVAAGLANWATLYLLRTTESQNAETELVGPSYMLSKYSLFEGAPVSTAVWAALACVIAVAVLFRKTVFGFELKAAGENEIAAEFSGIDSAKAKMRAMAVSGALAGLVAVPEVLGNSGRFKLDFSPGYGFIGIAVALLGRGNPLGILASALLFGALQKGSGDLDIETETVTRDLALILQALVILSVASEGFWDRIWKRLRFAR